MNSSCGVRGLMWNSLELTLMISSLGWPSFLSSLMLLGLSRREGSFSCPSSERLECLSEGCLSSNIEGVILALLVPFPS
jgi:hypothetical protein